MKLLFLIFLLTLHFSLPLYAQVTVAFIKGNKNEFTPNGKFFHVAVSHNGGWLHADIARGIEVVSDIAAPGEEVVYIKHNELQEPSKQQVKQLLRKKFNLNSSWDNMNSTYCSKLVGQLFDLTPTPMLFKSPDWDIYRHRLPVGQLGLSPDEVYSQLLELGFKRTNLYLKNMCFRALTSF